ncbi:MAG: hypothetical protein HRT98_02825 [Mycoplasmatales bacterium]|nr:hypothetical protein [Mycoplasmatales bacterium]
MIIIKRGKWSMLVTYKRNEGVTTITEAFITLTDLSKTLYFSKETGIISLLGQYSKEEKKSISNFIRMLEITDFNLCFKNTIIKVNYPKGEKKECLI